MTDGASCFIYRGWKTRAEGKTTYLKRGDIDNIIKAVLDALNGYAYKDDSAVFSVYGRKIYTAGEPFTAVTISSVEVDHEL